MTDITLDFVSCWWEYLKNLADGDALEPEVFKAMDDEFEKLKKENEKLKEDNKRLKNMIHDTEEFLEVCDRNADGYYKHYETRQIATRFEGGVYRTQKD